MLAVCWLIAKLPVPALIACGAALGRLIFITAGRARHIASVNIRLCFPDKSEEEHNKLLLDSFMELGISFAETLQCWFGDADGLVNKKVTVEGLDYWQEALKRDNGIILLSCHYASPDLNSLLVSRFVGDRKFTFTYRQPSDAVVDRISNILRRKISRHSCPIKHLKSVLRALKQKHVVWCAPDIEVCKTQGVFADFMGVPSVTSILVSRLSRTTGAVVLPCAHYRTKDNRSYTLKIFPPMNNFPSSSPAEDAATQNRQFAKILSPRPERYWWIIKRFKRRPMGEKGVY